MRSKRKLNKVKVLVLGACILTNLSLIGISLNLKNFKENKETANAVEKTDITNEIEDSYEIKKYTYKTLEVDTEEVNKPEKELKKVEPYILYTTGNVNIRKQPNVTSKVIDTVPVTVQIKVIDIENDEWYKIEYNGEIAYVYAKYLTEKEVTYTNKEVPHNTFKSFMGYKAITSRSSYQWKLQQEASTGKYGIRVVDGRYCIALGTYYSDKVGTKVDVQLEDGTVLYCILGDVKDNKHTDKNNMQHTVDGSVLEFVIDREIAPNIVKKTGSYSSIEAFKSNVVSIKILNEN